MTTTHETAAAGGPETVDDVRGAWRIVAGREISTRLRQKSFVWSAVAMVVGVVATVVLSSLLGGKPTHYTVAVVDPADSATVSAASTALDGIDDGSTAEASTVDDRAAAERAVSDGDADVALLGTDEGYELIGDSEIDGDLSAVLSAAVANAVLEENAAEQGVDLTELQAGASVTERLLDSEADSAGQRYLVAFVLVLIFYVTAITFGMTLAQSIVQEKESRIVEILAAAVPTRALLWGKLVGNTVLALGQVVLLVGAGVASMVAVGETDLLGDVGPALGWYVPFFILGFLALSGLWAVAGSLASRTEDLQSTTMPSHVILFAPYILALTAGGAVKTVGSMLPILSAMMMPARLAEESVPAWQIAVALGANVIAIVLLIRLAARVYRRTLMRTERRIGFAEALRLTE